MARLISTALLLAVVLAPLSAEAAPVVIAAVGAAVSTGVAWAVGTAVTWATFGAAFATNLALSVLGGLLSKSPEAPSSGGGFAAEARGRQVVIRSATESRRIIYGEVSVSGPLTFAMVSGPSNEYLHLVIPVAGHEVDAIGAVYLNDDEVGTLDASGNCTSGKFAGLLRVRKYLGTLVQAADPDLVAESDGLWTTAHQGLGVAYLYLRMRFDQTAFPNGIPNVKAIVRGKKCYDPRDAGTRFTSNWALICRDYLKSDYGLACADSEIDDTVCAAAANTCDERVLVDGGSPRYSVNFTLDTGTDIISFADAEKRFDTGDGVAAFSTGTLPSALAGSPNQFYFIRKNATSGQLASTYANAIAGVAIDLTDVGTGTHSLQHVDQARYTANGTVNMGDTPESIIPGILSAAVGAIVYQQGVYKIYPAAYRAPTMDLDEDCLNGGMQVTPRMARADLYNGVRGTYVDPTKNWQSTDFPPVTNATYETQDGGEQILRDIQFPFTTNNIRAQRMAKIILERSRQAITVQMPCNLSVLKLAPWDTVRLSNTILGWTDKIFMVLGWQFSEKGGIELQLQEEAAAVYDWNFGDATLVDPAPDTNLPSVETIRNVVPARVTGLQVFGEDALATTWDGRDLKVIWRRTSLFDQGGDDFFFKDYEVRVYKTDGTLLRTEHVVDNTYTYSFEKNNEDTLGAPVRSVIVKVWARTRYNQISALPASISVSNPVPVITGFTTSASAGGFEYAFDRPTDTDYAGIRIYVSHQTGFTMNASTLVYQGSKNSGSAPVLYPGLTHRLRMVPYDVFGDGAATDEIAVQTLFAAPQGRLGPLDFVGAVSVINTFTLAVGETTRGACYCPLNGLTYVVSSTDNVYAVDMLRNEIVATIALTLGDPFAICWDPVNEKLAVTDWVDDEVQVIDPATNTAGTVIACSTGSGSFDIAFSPSTSKLYLPTGSVINLATETESSVIDFATPVGFAPDRSVVCCPLNNNVYVSTGNSIHYASMATEVYGGAVTGLTHAWNTGMVLSGIGGKIYVASGNTGGGSPKGVTPIDVVTNAAGTPISLGVTGGSLIPEDVCFVGSTQKLYVAYSSAVYSIDPATDTLLMASAGFGVATRLAWDPRNNRVMATNEITNPGHTGLMGVLGV